MTTATGAAARAARREPDHEPHLLRVVGRTQPQIWRDEEGEHNPSMETITRLCDALGLEVTITIGPKTEPRREVPAELQRIAVCDATDQVVISVREA